MVKLYKELDKLRSSIEGTFEDKIAMIVDKSRQLLDINQFKRKIIRRYLPDQLYAITKLVEISKEKWQFLNPDCNWSIYNKIPDIDSSVEHERSNIIDLFKKVKRLGRHHSFDGLSKA